MICNLRLSVFQMYITFYTCQSRHRRKIQNIALKHLLNNFYLHSGSQRVKKPQLKQIKNLVFVVNKQKTIEINKSVSYFTKHLLKFKQNAQPTKKNKNILINKVTSNPKPFVRAAHNFALDIRKLSETNRHEKTASQFASRSFLVWTGIFLNEIPSHPDTHYVYNTSYSSFNFSVFGLTLHTYTYICCSGCYTFMSKRAIK